MMLTLVEQVAWTLRVTSQIPDIGTMAMIKMMLKLTPGGEEGVCTLPRQCLGEKTVAGPCTIFKSVCCMERLTCNNTISQTVGSIISRDLLAAPLAS